MSNRLHWQTTITTEKNQDSSLFALFVNQAVTALLARSHVLIVGLIKRK
jgi:hypothetical protein